MNKIALRHCITLFLGNFTALTSIAYIQCVYKWNVGVRFEGDEEGDLKMMDKIKGSCDNSMKCHGVVISGINELLFLEVVRNEIGSPCFQVA